MNAGILQVEKKPYRVTMQFREDLSDGDLSISKELVEVMEKFPDQMITFDIPLENGAVKIHLTFDKYEKTD